MTLSYVDIEKILDEHLSYSMSQPECNHLMELIQNGNETAAKEILTRYLNDDTVSAVYAHLVQESLGEHVNLEEIPIARWGYYLGNTSLARKGKDFRVVWCIGDRVFFGNEEVKLSHLHQMWHIVPKK